MSDLFALVLGLRAVRSTLDREARSVVPEPEFVPFRLPSRSGATGPAPCAARIQAANTTREPRTLAELGVPRSLATEIEETFRMLRMTDGNRVVGYTFRSTDGASHALRVGPAAAPATVEDGSDRAA